MKLFPLIACIKQKKPFIHFVNLKIFLKQLTTLHCVASIILQKQKDQGIYLITPFMRYEMTVELVEYINFKESVGLSKLIENR